jgi:replicative DNA helicase
MGGKETPDMKAGKSDMELHGRLMPSDVDIERKLTGVMLLFRNATEVISGLLTPEMFYDDRNRIIYESILALHSAGRAIDMTTVSAQLKASGSYDAAGGLPYLVDTTEGNTALSHIGDYCDVIRMLHARRMLIESAIRATGEAFDPVSPVDDTAASLSLSLDAIQELLTGKSEGASLYESGKKSIEEMMQRITDAKNSRTTAITTGFADLNRLVYGWKPERLILLAARPGVRKTSLAIHFAMRAAKTGSRVLFFSLEMGKTELSDRTVIRESGVDSYRYNTGTLEYGEAEKAISAAESLKQFPVTIDDTPKVNIAYIANRARLMKRRNLCDLVIVDYLQLIMPNTRQNRNRENEVSEISRMLKLTAKELKVPFIVLCQMNREFDKEKNREPRLSDLRESGSLEQDADVVMFIHRPEKGGKMMELHVKKNRSGRCGKVAIACNESLTNFYDAVSSPASDTAYRNYYETDNTPF